MTGSLQPQYFDRLYAEQADPWSFASSEYEHAKYAASIAALGGRRFARGFEVGCSIGVLTRRLAADCDDLLSVDVAEAALEQARRRCADLPQVRFTRMQVPEQWPEQQFELIVLSEVLYYLDPLAIDETANRVCGSAALGALVLLVHWLGETNYPTSGDDAAERFIAACAGNLAPVQQDRTAQYRLDLLARH